MLCKFYHSANLIDTERLIYQYNTLNDNIYLTNLRVIYRSKGIFSNGENYKIIEEKVSDVEAICTVSNNLIIEGKNSRFKFRDKKKDHELISAISEYMGFEIRFNTLKANEKKKTYRINYAYEPAG